MICAPPHPYFGSNVLYQESPEYPCMICALASPISRVERFVSRKPGIPMHDLCPASRIFRVERFVSGEPGIPMHDLCPRLTHISGRTFCIRKARNNHAWSVPSPHPYLVSNVLCKESPEYPCMICALASRIFRVERFVSGKPGIPMHDLCPRLTHISCRTFCVRKARNTHA